MSAARATSGDSADFVRAMEPVARKILGEPTTDDKVKRELRFGTRGSLCISLAKGTWFCHETNVGGGVLDFVQTQKYLDKDGAFKWLRDNNFIAKRNDAKKANGATKVNGKLGTQVATYDYKDANGKLLFQVVRFEPKDFRQRRPNGSGGWTWKLDDVERVLYRLPELLAAQPTTTVYVAEGEKDVDALRQRLLVATCNPGGVGKWKQEYNTYFSARHVIVLSDNDPQAVDTEGKLRFHPDGRPVFPGQDHAADVAKNLRGIASNVRVLMLPNLPPKGDVSDWLAAGGTVDELERLAREAPEALPDPPEAPSYAQNAPTVTVLPGLRHEAADAGLAAMRAADVQFFQRDRVLVRVCRVTAKVSDGTEVTSPGIVPVTLPTIARALGKSASWQRLNARGKPVHIDPPREVVEQIGSMLGEWPFESLIGVIGTQTLRPDGSLLCNEGYDPATGLYLLAPPPMPDIPDRPTKQDALEGLALLNGLLTEFPFTNGASRSVGMSMVMTPVLRGAVPPASPIHSISAPESGTGKSYLGDTASAVASGERCAVQSVAPKEEETEKRLIGAALAGLPIIALDNVNGVLRGDFLCQVSERPVMLLRPLGGSGLVRVPNTFTVFVNGNNLTIAADLTRRSLRCTMDANTEDPTSRTFTSDPVATVLADRGRYVAAILTIARAYIAAGQPNPPHPLPSFERWSSLVCGALTWLGWDNPMDTMSDIRGDDPGRQLLAAVLEAWPDERTSYLTSELIEEATRCHADGSGPVWPAWLEAVKAIARDHRGNLDPTMLGNWLRDHRGRISGQRKLVRTDNTTRPRWAVTS